VTADAKPSRLPVARISPSGLKQSGVTPRSASAAAASTTPSMSASSRAGSTTSTRLLRSSVVLVRT